ncbi:SAM-dependent methyltransferase [Streptosporangium album]|uniref:SAM-dependent methyltransferase n=1 Tax=Streptosporangium album TaxID=47479 RepID=A0A7W7WDX7_9ACTN|nr:methyltransferase domain-containing protein [Streptosporangium album]MBB4943591.1 SAM-dependent methyltransferase [Streptosporangium album]
MIGAFYEDSLSGRSVTIEYADGRVRPLTSARWLRPIEGDDHILARCEGPTLDVGSGPGRLTVALTRMGIPVLGIDISPLAVSLTRSAGGPALLRSVFDPLPGIGRWSETLLADGNIGIGGDPAVLLRRLRELLRPGGAVIAELSPPGTRSGMERLRLRQGDRVEGWFPWATVSADDIGLFGRRCGFPAVERWDVAGRWFATMS